jgi:hypothetical protein
MWKRSGNLARSPKGGTQLYISNSLIIAKKVIKNLQKNAPKVLTLSVGACILGLNPKGEKCPYTKFKENTPTGKRLQLKLNPKKKH